MNDVRTDASGRSVRGKAVLRMSRPPPTTDLAPWLIDAAHESEREESEHQVREEVGARGCRRARSSTSMK